jgi:hypothetical protein
MWKEKISSQMRDTQHGRLTERWQIEPEQDPLAAGILFRHGTFLSLQLQLQRLYSSEELCNGLNSDAFYGESPDLSILQAILMRL